MTEAMNDTVPLTPGRAFRVPIAIGALVSFTAIVITTFVGGGWLGAVPHSSVERIYSVSGVGAQVLPDTFRVQPGWELRWEHDGGIQQIRWTSDKNVVQMMSDLPERPLRQHGSMNVVDGGEYRLEVRGKGAWKFNVYQLQTVR